MDKSLPDKNVQKILRLKEEINQELQELELLREEIKGLKNRLKNPSLCPPDAIRLLLAFLLHLFCELKVSLGKIPEPIVLYQRVTPLLG